MILKNRSVAAAVSAVLVLLAIFVGSRGDLLRLRGQAEVYFFGDMENGIIGIRDDLSDKAESAYSLTSVGTRYLDESDELIKSVREYSQALKTAENAGEAFAANEKLTAACESLSQELSTKALSAKDADYNRALLDEIKSFDLIIARSEYNELAAGFNKLLSRFPTALCAKIAFVGDLPLYE